MSPLTPTRNRNPSTGLVQLNEATILRLTEEIEQFINLSKRKQEGADRVTITFYEAGIDDSITHEITMDDVEAILDFKRRWIADAAGIELNTD